MTSAVYRGGKATFQMKQSLYMYICVIELIGWLVDSLHPSKQFFSHVGTEPPLPGELPVLFGE